MPPPTAITTTLRRATRADLPRMVRILLDAFAGGPWGRHVCPPHLKVKPGDSDEFDWRMHALSSGLETPGRETVLACQGEEVVGWAQWTDLGAAAGAGPPLSIDELVEREIGPGGGAGVDREALRRLRSEGRQLERSFEEVLGAERSGASWSESRPDTCYLLIPKRQKAAADPPCGSYRSGLPGRRPQAPAGRHRQAAGQGGPRQGGGPGEGRVPAGDARGPPLVPGLGLRGGPRAEDPRGERVCHGAESH